MVQELTEQEYYLLKNSFASADFLLKELQSNPFAKLLVYKQNQKIIGYLYYSEIYERVEINQFEVDFIHRNCGIGNKLLKFLIDSVEKNITLEVRQDNESAIHLYQKHGFKKVAVREGYYHGTDGILMERRIK